MCLNVVNTDIFTLVLSLIVSVGSSCVLSSLGDSLAKYPI